VVNLTTAIFILSGRDAAAAADCLRRMRCGSEDPEEDWHRQDESGLESLVQDWYLAWSQDQEVACHNPTNQSEGLRAHALEWVAELRVFRWVSTQNHHRRVAPSILDVLSEFVKQC
jgi:hypothetical protein